jgi:hypothetical protein
MKTMQPTLREQILAIDDRTRVAVVVTEWNAVTVYAAPLSSAQQIDYAAALADQSDGMRRALLVIFGTEDEAGRPVFNMADAEALSRKNWKSLHRLAEVILGKSETVDDAKKNSSALPS